MWELLIRKNETKERLVELWKFESDLGTFFKSLTTYVDPSSNYVKIAETSMEFIPELGVLPATTWDWVEVSNVQTPPGVHGVDIKVEIVNRIVLANTHYLYRSITEYRDPANGMIKNADEAIKASMPNDGGVTMGQLNTILAQYRQYSAKTHSLVDNGKFADLQTAIDACVPGDIIVVGACPDGMTTWGDGVLIPNITIMGAGAPTNEQCRLGKITFAPTTGTELTNVVTLANVQFDSGVNTASVFFAGTAPITVRMTGCTVRRDQGTAALMQVGNGATQSTVIMNGCLVKNVGTSTGIGIVCGMANFRINDSVISKASLQCVAGLMQVSHCNVEYLNLSANDSLSVIAGQMAVSHSVVRNNGVGSNGAVISTGATLGFISSTWDLADLTGYAVMGAGNIVVNEWTFTDFPGNPRNTKVQDTITILPLTNTPTVVS